MVGAGLAGLTCVLDLVEAGWDVTVLEARERVGGRVHTVRGEREGGSEHGGVGVVVAEDKERVDAKVAGEGDEGAVLAAAGIGQYFQHHPPFA